MLKQATGPTSTTFHVQVFDSLRLDGATWSGLTLDYENDATTQSAYIGGFAHVAYTDSVPTTTTGLHVFLTVGDQLGSATAVVDKDTGELVEEVSYDAFGQTDSDYRPSRWAGYRERFRFGGQEDDIEIGLMYMGARYYSPNLTRWISPDPLNVHAMGSSWNPYSYVYNAPTMGTDPLGLDPPGADDGVNTGGGWALGGLVAAIVGAFEGGSGASASTSGASHGGGGGSGGPAPLPPPNHATGSTAQLMARIALNTALDVGSRVLPRQATANDRAKSAGLLHGIYNGYVGAADETLKIIFPPTLYSASGPLPAVTIKALMIPGGSGSAYRQGEFMGAFAFQGTLAGAGAAVEGATAGEQIAGAGAGRATPFNPSGSRVNCVNSVCAFLNSVKRGSLVTSSEDVAENLGSIRAANEQIAAQTGVTFGQPQQSTLLTANARQFYVVYPGRSATAAEHVLIGINNGGKSILYDPQIGAKIFNVGAFGPFVAFPVRL